MHPVKSDQTSQVVKPRIDHKDTKREDLNRLSIEALARRTMTTRAHDLQILLGGGECEVRSSGFSLPRPSAA